MSWTSRARRVAGIMTGTSLDGIDVAICNIQDGTPETVTLESWETHSYDDELRQRIEYALEQPMTASEVLKLDVGIAAAFAEILNKTTDVKSIDAVGMHGQTIWHQPPIGSWQAGNSATLAALIDVPVVANMRSSDVALGGQGAPLVPLFDAMSFSHPVEHVASVNIGGMANVTSLPPISSSRDVIAFDTGPGNVLIDAATTLLFGKKYDTHGAMAREGRVIPRLLEQLTSDPFIDLPPPKSTGREVFNKTRMAHLLDRFSHSSLPSEDIIATVTEFTVWSIATHIERYLPEAQRIVVSGGGVHNTFMMEQLVARLASRQVMTSDVYGIPIDAKEAMCWAYLAWRTLAGRHGNVPSATGASHETVLGHIAMPKNGLCFDEL